MVSEARENLGANASDESSFINDQGLTGWWRGLGTISMLNLEDDVSGGWQVGGLVGGWPLATLS